MLLYMFWFADARLRSDSKKSLQVNMAISLLLCQTTLNHPLVNKKEIMRQSENAVNCMNYKNHAVGD